MNLYTHLLLATFFSILPICAVGQSTQKDPSNTKKIAIVQNLDGVRFSNKGHFLHHNDVTRFLKRAAQEGKISASFKEIQEARTLTKESAASWANEQLFLVKCANGGSYIVKEIKQDKDPRGEIERLERARKAACLQRYIYPKSKGSLQAIFPTDYVRYVHHNKEHILVIMPKAKGICMQSIMEKFKHDPYDQSVISLACKAYYDLGKAMAKFYQNHGTLNHTIIHNDLHHGNIFYDAKSRLVTLIDNERITNTIEHPSDISSDLSFLFVTSPFVIEWGKPGFIKGLDFNRWYKITLTSFILGFIRAYPNEQRPMIFNALKALLLTWNTNVRKEDSREIRTIITQILVMNEKNNQNLEYQFLIEGKSELHIAAGNPDLTGLVKILLDEKSKAVNKRDRDGNNPLHEAAYYGCLKAAKLLLKEDCNKNARNNKGETPLYKAQFQNNRSLIALLQA